MTYRAPVADIAFALKHAAGLKAALAEGLYGELDEATVDSVLEEAGRFASDVIAPLNRVGDKFGTPFKDGNVTTPPGWKEAYTAWAAAGWNGLVSPIEYGGQELPQALNAACVEMWNSSSMAFGIGPVLTMAAIDALAVFGSQDLKQKYLGKLVSGEWMGTMQLTEPQAGSDVGALRTRAARADDGSYRITGGKIFITYGEHDLTDNIIHFVLARLLDAPAGTKGISLFLVPKVMPDGKRNDVRAHSVEHKLGIHGSPTCTMVYGDNGGATGFLRWNFKPAKIFMGDGGSLFIGFVLASAAVEGKAKGAIAISLVVPFLIILAFPILDTAHVIMRRLRSGAPLFAADRSHTHHKLLDLGLSQRAAVNLIYAVCGVLCALVLVLARPGGPHLF